MLELVFVRHVGVAPVVVVSTATAHAFSVTCPVLVPGQEPLLLVLLTGLDLFNVLALSVDDVLPARVHAAEVSAGSA